MSGNDVGEQNVARACHRRRIVATVGVGILGGLAGCLGRFGNDSSDSSAEAEEYEHLKEWPVYVADGLDLSVPPAVHIEASPSDADLIVLLDETETDVSRAIDWLADGRVLAVVGEDAQETVTSWMESDAFTDEFGEQMVGGGEPEPELVMAVDSGSIVSTHRFSWEDGPADSDILWALNKQLDDLDRPT